METNTASYSFSSEVLSEVPEMIRWRRHLHQHPELSFHEETTTAYILNILKNIPGLEIRRPARTGCIAVLRGTAKEPLQEAPQAGYDSSPDAASDSLPPSGKPAHSRAILLRADIDALPIQEENNLPYRSVCDGVMHACGHDGHTAMMLAAAKVLSAHRDQLRGEVHFLFQHAEELPPGGAAELERLGVMNGIDELYGLHLSSNFPTGSFGVRAGALTSATDRFDIRILGKGGHSAFPETTVDPIVIAGHIITELQTIVSRRIRAVEPAVVSICQLEAGSAYNIIPGEVSLTGSTRTFSGKTREKMPVIMEQIVKGLCDSAGASYDFRFSLGYASVVNDRELTGHCRREIARWFGPDAVLDIDPLMPGEDFSALQTHCPGFFVELGARSEEKGITAPHHNSHYLLDEDALAYGLQYWVDLVQDRLQ